MIVANPSRRIMISAVIESGMFSSLLVGLVTAYDRMMVISNPLGCHVTSERILLWRVPVYFTSTFFIVTTPLAWTVLMMLRPFIGCSDICPPTV